MTLRLSVALTCLLLFTGPTAGHSSTWPQGRSCSILNCDNHSSSIFLSMNLRTDGIGATLHHMLNAGAYATFRGWNFGFMHYSKRLKAPLVSHNVSKIKVFDFFFGNGSRFLHPTGHFRNVKNSENNQFKTIEFDSMDGISQYRGDSPAHIILKHHRVDLEGDFDKYFTASYLNALRCDLLPGLEKFNNKRHAMNTHGPLKVVAHFRSGDLIADINVRSRRGSRIQAIESYFDMFKTVRKLYPDALLSAYTSSIQPNSDYDKYLLTSFNSRGIELTIDSELGDVQTVTSRTLSTFSRLIEADILLLAKSSFSHVAGFHNPNCILYEEYTGEFKLFWESYLPKRWIQLKNSSFEIENLELLKEHLPDCVRSRPRTFCE